MTAQVSDKLISYFDEIDFDGLHLYSVLRGEPSERDSMVRYDFKNSPDKEKFVLCSACWNGYACGYELSEHGELTLVEFWYPFILGVEPDRVFEVLNGDFWLCLRKGFFEESLYVPFRDGKLVADKGEWVDSKSLSDSGTSTGKLTIKVLSRIKKWMNVR